MSLGNPVAESKLSPPIKDSSIRDLKQKARLGRIGLLPLKTGAEHRIRTDDPCFTKALLYQLS